MYVAYATYLVPHALQRSSAMDVSADLHELSRNQVAVVSAGIKSILDIGR